MLFYGASLIVCTVFMKGRGSSCHAVNPFEKAERITVKQKFFATQGDETHGGGGVTPFQLLPKGLWNKPSFLNYLILSYYRYWSG